MSEYESFVERVLKHLPSSSPTAFAFFHWAQAGRPTEEGVALLPVPGADPEKVVAAVMDVGHYVGNIDHVAESRAIADPRFVAPDHVRFYQRVDLPMLGAMHHELVLHRMGTRSGFAIAAWEVLRAETDALSSKVGARSDYNHGAWLVAPGLVGYALGSAPKRDDVGFLKWKALTAGADAAAPRVLRGNIEGMARWAARR
ncbi:MAG: hypothetical protein HY901_28645 [Deltaproteobacteria bacterium]|nr:hypothetical protein [Deltaproteobacteria bacterium]